METSMQPISSIGAAWPPATSSHNRLRGFYTEEVLAGQLSIDRLQEHITSSLETINTSNDLDRVSIRAVTERNTIARLNYPGILIEAALPIADTNLTVVYLGVNQPNRAMSDLHLDRHRQLLRTVCQTPVVPPTDNLPVQVVDPHQSTDLVDGFVPLYQAFDYDQADTEALLNDNSNIIAFTEVDGIIASTAMAELASIAIEGYGNIHLAEITEASTHPDFRQRGLYSATSGFLIQHLVDLRCQQERQIDVIYGESNLAMPGVVHAAHQNQRRFSLFERQSLGVTNPAFGILPQNFKVHDGTETRAYNDFAVSYVPLQRSSQC